MDFRAKYNRNAFVEFFSASLLPEDFETATETVEPDFKSRYFQSITYLGQCPSLDLNVYEIRHTSERDARVGLSRDAFKLVSRYGANNALILFVPENPDNFRLSLVSIEPKLDAKGVKILKEYSNPRRYSFVLGDDAKTHTPEQYLIALGRITDNADLTKRFSVEVVNKEFYGQIAEMFSKLVGGQRKKGNRTVEYQRQLVLPSVTADHEQKYKEFAVRLIGRTVFCWFLKKKKSDKGVPLIHNDVLSRFAADFTPNFYHARVEPLFFEVLNTSVDKRKPEYKIDPFDKIPFLNGGLFEPHLDDFYKVNHVTGTSEYLNTLKIPDEWWKELLDILETYNFTIDENTSIDIDLSVDPEMLGRIFENLLAEINPETGDTARKATGSYYTPRPIVEYMVDQSLKQYLVTKTALDETKFDTLLDYSNEASGLSEAEEKAVIEALNTIKILDPACGSGAFPMGMLQKMLLILQKVDHGAQNSVQQILNEITDPIKRELIKRKLEAAQVLDDVDFDDYARKLNVIQRSIYGVDIQPIATDISKLRFFLSLVVDEVIQDKAPNRGIEPLPNLEFKFVCANTLIPLPEADNFERMFGDAELVSGLENIRSRYFTASNDDKPALKKEFESLQKKLYDFLNQHGAGANITKSRFGLLATWKPFSDEAATWFDSKWMFGVDLGFDIVIGNPPYVFTRKGDFSSEFKTIINKVYLSNIGRTQKSKANQAGKINLFAIFILNGILQIKEGSCLSFIIPNNILRTTTFDIIRKQILDTCFVNEIVDLGSGVFEQVTASTIILNLKRKKHYNNHENFINIIKNVYSLKSKNFLLEKINQANFYKNVSYSFNIHSNEKAEVIFDKLRLNTIELGKLCIDIIEGIVAHKHLIAESQNDNYVPLIEGKDIKRYYIGQPKNYLLWDKKQIHRTRPDYLWESEIKIVIQRISGGSRPLVAAIDKNKYRTFASVNNLILSKEYQTYYPFILSLLNSRVLNYYYANNFSNNSELTVNISKTFLEKLPIPKVDENIRHIFNSLVLNLINEKKLPNNENCQIYEGVIDLMVYKLYELTYDEVKTIDPKIGKLISSADYERLDIEGLAAYDIKANA